FLDSYHPSRNTLGATFFTDGKFDAPMFVYDPLFARCPHCRGFFWIDDLKTVLEYPSCRPSTSTLTILESELPELRKRFERSTRDYERRFINVILSKLSDAKLKEVCQRHPELKILRKIRSPDKGAAAVNNLPWCLPFKEIPETFEFLDSGEVAGEKQEYTVRLEIWLTYNDRIRVGYGQKLRWSSSEFDGIVTQSPEDCERWQNNLVRLLELTERIEPEDYFRLAEINRHLGNFEAASAILEENQSSEEYDRIRKAILEGSQGRNRYILPSEIRTAPGKIGAAEKTRPPAGFRTAIFPAFSRYRDNPAGLSSLFS
ncbi:MAG: hypothetical protein J6S42_04925, partial [Thermoguttaceae bacterium]|nr:hypothetical protein [Thermoguttaceae bacterium]